MAGWTPAHTRVLAEAASKPAHPAPVTRRMAVRTSPLPGRGEGPYRTVNRDRVIQASSAPPGARQQWELYRVREESRDLEHRGAVWKAYVRFVRIQALGGDVSRIHYEHEEADKARLAEVVKRIRRDWMAWQRIRNLGGTGQTIHQMAGSVLHHTLVDGDCFITRRRAERGPVFDLHPGDSLAETSYSREARADGLMRQLGVEVDKHLRPMAFYFGDGGYMSRQLWGFHSYAGTSIKEKRIDAARVLHLRDRSGEVTAVRGWPLCTGVIEEIARLEEWYGALVRSATLRAAIGIALEKDPLLGSVGDLGGGLAPSDMNVHAVGSDEYDPNARTYGAQDVRPYQEFAIRGGSLMELLPGYKPHNIGSGAPTSQEAQAIGMLERRVCAGLRVTAATLLGDYAALSFSAGQLSHQQERQGIEDHQALLTDQFYPHVFTEFLMARWLGYVDEFGLKPDEDLMLLRYPRFALRKYQTVDKQRLVGPIIKAWESGILTYGELRAELGYAGANVDEVIAEWKENRRMLGLPEVPSAGGGGMMNGDGPPEKEDDDPDKAEKEGDDEDN